MPVLQQSTAITGLFGKFLVQMFGQFSLVEIETVLSSLTSIPLALQQLLTLAASAPRALMPL